MTKLRLIMSIEAAAFLAAALVHAGLLIGGYEHAKARIAETVMAPDARTGPTPPGTPRPDSR